MRTMTRLTFFSVAMLCAAWALAQQPPAGAPAGTTGLCKDGSYWSGATKKGACHGHKGVKEWYGSESAAAPASSTASTAAPPSTASTAGAPASAPAGTTGLCKDGSYWSGATKKGACHGHKGVKEWYGSTSTAASSAPSAPSAPSASTAASASTPAPAAAPAPAPAMKSEGAKRTAPTPAATAAPGGGPGQVWVNHKSKVYHCSGDRWYGKTEDGEYMTEAAATSAGYRPDHGKTCSERAKS